MKYKFNKLIIIVLLIVLFTFTGCKKKSSDKKVIVLDGGGDTANFNTTPSMIVSETNPFPYNTLEKLIEEWEKMNPEYDVQLRKTSYGGDRSSLLPMLKRANAPDIIYQNASVLSSDIGKGYYVAMDNYLEQPNKYNDNKPWKEVYNPAELAGTSAADGSYYYINLERYAAGIIYNKNLFTDLGIKVPTTFEEFMEAQKTLSANNKIPYLSVYPWYDIVLETNIFSPLISSMDTIIPNRKVDLEEFIRGYKKNIWKIDVSTDEDYNNGCRTAYEVYVDLICEKKQYEPLGAAGYDAITSFKLGNVGMIEATSESMRKIYYDKTKNFEIGIIGYPVVPYGSYKNKNYEGAGYACYRGSAGTATSWWVTNSAQKKGIVDGCVDLLMFLTSPKNNNRMIGDISGAIPLDPNAKVADYLQPILDMYNEDISNPNLYGWGAFCSWNGLDLEYNSYFLSSINALLAKRNSNGIVNDNDKRATILSIDKYTKISVEKIKEEMLYDGANW